ncbi:hypothetical protein SAMN05880574_1129 [Chryseobacterium sp. RU37D]|uniref:hypothetical protein n=1 Tax=Chryseobacterium sp. RU37D TaxID=1907397 RepID=UPI0009561C19|nr:hypothetical protein [Chryseobacterium sp. RU37D]SIQ39804.1 hypothetical protein SAMN05880574_1129 [Chryseobacterium sp. RU37D]
MISKFTAILIFLCGNHFFSQKFDKIEFESYNSLIIGNKINIFLEPLKNNKKGKVKVHFQDKNNSFVKKISKTEYNEISNNILKIKEKTCVQSKDSIKTRCIDGSDALITIFQNNTKKQYYIDCLSEKDRFDKNRMDFWNSTKLILNTVKMKNEDLY